MKAISLLTDTPTSEKRWKGNVFKCNSRNNFDLFCFDSVSSTHNSMPELILKTEFNKDTINAFLCFNKGRAKNGNLILADRVEIINRTIRNSNLTKIIEVSFNTDIEQDANTVLWEDFKEQVTSRKLVVDIFDLRSFNPVGPLLKREKPKTKNKTRTKQATKK